MIDTADNSRNTTMRVVPHSTAIHPKDGSFILEFAQIPGRYLCVMTLSRADGATVP